LCWRILRSYGVPAVKSCVAANLGEALDRAEDIGYPMVVKVASADVPHRSDVGAVVQGLQDADGLREAIERIARNVHAAVPDARIDGYEMQEQVRGDAEAVVGFAAAAPFGSLVLVGTGGTMVELFSDRAARLAPLTQEESTAMVRQTRLGKLLAGYRNLLPPTDLAPLATLVRQLSELAADLGDLIVECDLNPVLVKQQTGELRVVDALMIARGPV
jgi:acetyltransferase